MKVKVGDRLVYNDKVLCQVIAVEPNVKGLPFIGQTVWFLPLIKGNQFPFTLPSHLVEKYMSVPVIGPLDPNPPVSE